MSSFQFSLQFPSERGESRIRWQARALAVPNLSEMSAAVGRTAGDETHSEWISEAEIDGSRSRRFPETSARQKRLPWTQVQWRERISRWRGKRKKPHTNQTVKENVEKTNIFPEDTFALSSLFSPQRNIDGCQTEGNVHPETCLSRNNRGLSYRPQSCTTLARKNSGFQSEVFGPGRDPEEGARRSNHDERSGLF